MALSTRKGPDSDQGQIQSKSEEGQGLSQYLCGKILNGQGGKINSSGVNLGLVLPHHFFTKNKTSKFCLTAGQIKKIFFKSLICSM